ncbi:hypothetical protein E4T40_07122 [Aureobasidium subglaciale]|nr:hypothetical protein E4T40_07122 [Aureobasidium subglaciale]KAI5221380.1 hypothetical protein E4T41_07042 [Aureobasidium subglaciale]
MRDTWNYGIESIQERMAKIKSVLRANVTSLKPSMKSIFRSRQHSKAESETSDRNSGSTTNGEVAPTSSIEWWLARENAFDTACRVYQQLHRDSDKSYYSREQDYDQSEGDSDPSSSDWNASCLFWSARRSKMWVTHVASSRWTTIDLEDGSNRFTEPAATMATPESEPRIKAPTEHEGETEKKPESKTDSVIEIKPTAVKLQHKPKLTLQIPNVVPAYYFGREPNDYSSCKSRVTSEERVEWKKNMF